MIENTFLKPIERFTIENSRYRTKLDYIPLSKIYTSPEILVDEYLHGRRAGKNEQLKCYKGYQMEDDLMRRLRSVYPGEISDGGEISIEDGLFKGHPDFSFRGLPGDVKSLLMDEYLPFDHHVSPKNFYQIQAYMLFMEKPRGYLLFESRQSGALLALSFAPNEKIQNNIRERIGLIKELLSRKDLDFSS